MPTLTVNPSTVFNPGAWTNPANVFTSNSANATLSASSNNVSNPMQVRGFNFSTVGAGDTLNSLTASIQHFENQTTQLTLDISLVDGDVILWTQSVAPRTAKGVNTYTVTGVTVAQLKSATLGLRIEGMKSGGGGSRTFTVDHVYLTATYTAAVAPTGTPTLTAGTATASTVPLSWTAVSNATSYEVRRGGVLVHTTSSLSWTDTGLEPGTTYSYDVRGVNATGAGPYSTAASATTGAVLAYPDEVLADAPLEYWRLEETSTASTAASSSGGTALTNSGGVTFAQPLGPAGIGDGAWFTAAFSSHLRADGVAPVTTLPVTFEAWIKGTSTGVIVNQSDINSITSYLELAHYSAGLAVANRVDSNNPYVTGPLANDGQAHHVVAVINRDGTVLLYVDGQPVLVSGTTNSTSIGPAQNTLSIGARRRSSSYGQEYFDGQIDEVAIYDYALSAARVLAHYEAGITEGSSEPALVVRAARSGGRASRPLLAQASPLTVRAARSASRASRPLLAQASALLVRAARSTGRASRPLLTQTTSVQLVVRAARSTGRASRPLLEQASGLLVRAARSAGRSVRPLLAQASTVAVRSTRSTGRSSRPLLGQASPLAVRAARTIGRSSRPLLTQASALAVRSARSGSRASRPLLTLNVPGSGRAFADAFGRADGPLGADWQSTSTQTPIAGGMVVGASSANASRWSVDTDTGEQFSELTYQDGAVFLGPAVAMPALSGATLSQSGSWYVFRQQGSASVLHLAQKDVGAGTHASLAVTELKAAAGDRLRLTWDGTTLVGYRNGAEVIRFTPTSPLPSTQRGVGFSHGSSTQAGVPLLDDWTGGDLGGPSQEPALLVRAAASTGRASRPLLGQSSSLTVRSARSSGRLSRPLLGQVSTLLVRGARSTGRTTRPLLGQVSTLAVRSNRSSGRVIRPLLGQASSLLVRATRSTGRVMRPLLAQASSLLVRPARSSGLASTPTLTQNSVLLVRATRSTGRASRPSLAVLAEVTGLPTASTGRASRPLLAQNSALAVKAATSGGRATRPLLSQGSALAVRPAASGGRATRPLLGQASPLTVRPAASTGRASRPLLVVVEPGTVTGRPTRSTGRASRPLLGQTQSPVTGRPTRSTGSVTRPLLAQTSPLTVRRTRSTGSFTRPRLTQLQPLTIRPAASTGRLSKPRLGQTSALLLRSTRSTGRASRPTLQLLSVLVVEDTRSTGLASRPRLGQVHPPLRVLDSHSTGLASRPLLLLGLPPLPDTDRIRMIGVQDRTVAVSADSRTRQVERGARQERIFGTDRTTRIPRRST